MVQGISDAITKLFDILVMPFGSHRSAALIGISLVCGVVMIYIFKATSNQNEIKRARDLFKARILEMRLYQDDIVLILKALWGAIASNGMYLKVSLKPILVLVAFMAIVFIQLDARYGAAPLNSGSTTLVTVQLADGVDVMSTPTSIYAGEGMSLDAVPVRVPDRNTITWRLHVDGKGDHTVRIQAFEGAYDLPVVATWNNDAIGRSRTRSAANALLHPGLPVLPGNAPIAAVHLTYPGRNYSLLGWHTHWLIVFIICSFVGAMIPKFLFKIEV